MPLEVKVKTVNTWKRFYAHYDVPITGTPNDQGWVNFNCCLPTHYWKDTKHHGGVNLRDGRYKCWSGRCRERYLGILDRPASSAKESLSAAEFLMLTQQCSRKDADAIVESYRLEEGKKPEDLHEDTFTSTYSPSRAWEVAVKEAQAALTEDLEIVQEYMASRGLRYETLVQSGMGYLEEQDCLIHPYYQNGMVVGIRARTFDGRKGGVPGGHATLYGLQFTEQTSSRTCVLCEGETDTLSVRQLLGDVGYDNIPVLGTPGNHFSAQWTRHLQAFNRVILISQTDDASRKLIETASKYLPTKIEVVIPPFPPQSHGKDVSDFLRLEEKNSDHLVDLLGLTGEDREALPYVMNSHDLMTLAQVQVPWLIRGLIERGTKTLLIGEPKTYKTWIALNLLACVTRGTPMLGVQDWVPESLGRAVLIEEEGSPHRLGQRLSRVFQGHHADYYVIHRQGVMLDNDDSFTRLRQEVLSLKPDLIVFDPYASLHTQDENSSQGTMVVMNAINVLLRALPRASVIIIHHTPKGGTTARGSGALWGAMDLQIAVSRKDEPGEVMVAIRGRDLGDEKQGGLDFIFDAETGLLMPTGDEEIQIKTPRQKTDKSDDLRTFLEGNPQTWYSTSDLKEKLSVDSSFILGTALKKLFDDGLIESQGGGFRGSPKEYRWKNGKENA